MSHEKKKSVIMGTRNSLDQFISAGAAATVRELECNGHSSPLVCISEHNRQQEEREGEGVV